MLNLFFVLFCFLKKEIFLIKWNNPIFLLSFSHHSPDKFTPAHLHKKQAANLHPSCMWTHPALRMDPIRWPSWERKWAEVTLWLQQASNVSRNTHNSHGIHVLFKHQIEYCRNSCCKFVYVRLDIAVNQYIRCSLTMLQTGLEFQHERRAILTQT